MKTSNTVKQVKSKKGVVKCPELIKKHWKPGREERIMIPWLLLGGKKGMNLQENIQPAALKAA